MSVDIVLIANRVPVKHFSEVPHEARAHYSLENPRQIEMAARQLMLSQVAYKARLEPCPHCALSLVVTILGEKPDPLAPIGPMIVPRKAK